MHESDTAYTPPTPRDVDDAQVGDVLEARGLPGAPTRRGVISEVIGSGVHLHFKVRWDEEHESLYFPGDCEGVRVYQQAEHGHHEG